MNKLNKYLRIAKEAVIEPGYDIENRIIDRIGHIDEKDSRLLDEGFLDFFRKHNSMLYLIGRKLKDRPGVFVMAVCFLIAVVAAATFLLRAEKEKSA